MKKPSRRHFITMALGAAGAGGWAAFGVQSGRLDRRAFSNGVGGHSSLNGFESPLVKVKRSGFAFGTEIQISAFHSNRAVAQKAVSAAFDELNCVEALMSLYRSDSQVCCLNREGVLRNPHPFVVEILEIAQAMSERSCGGFDVSVQPLWVLYSNAQKNGVLPSESEVQIARNKVNWRAIKIDKANIRFTKPNMALTLNGLAQGFAADRTIAALRKHGVTHAMVNTGEIGTLGYKDTQDKVDWQVGIQHPRADDAFVALAELHGGCMATSGDYATPFSDDLMHHHIFDPRTGRSPTAFSSVTVVSPKCVDADGLSTMAFVCDLEKAKELIEETAGAEALFVGKDGSIWTSSGFPRSS